MKKITVSLLSAVLMLSMAFSSSVFAAEKTSAWDSFLGLFSAPTTAADTVGVEYRGHIENVGNYPTDGTWVEGPNRLGTVGQSLRLEGFWIQLIDAPADLHIQYEVHVQNVGWMAPVEDGTFAGTEGMSWRIEAIKISLVDDNGEVSDDYTVMYKGHVQNYGDTKWYSNGEQLGTTGSNLRLEALEVKIVKNASDLTKYQAALEAVNEADYTATSWAAYMEVVEANEVTAANTQSEVDEATANIVAAQENLVPAGDVVSIAAINATTVEVTYAEELTSVKAADYVFDPALTVSNAAVKQTNKKVAVLTIADATPGETYTLSGTDLSFTAISSVIPSAIALDTNSVQAVVGDEVTLAATVTVGEGESAAGIPVTFNVDAPVGSLNSDIIEEVFTDENGVATYTYTQYAAGTDAVAAYPTGKTTTRATANVFWGVADIMTVTESASGDAVNGTSRTYTVTLKNPANNVAIQNAVVNVMLAENIMANGTTAVVADPNTGGTAVSPFESATDEGPFTITTNTNGVATFTLTGANTTATPIIFLDSNAAVLANAGIAGNNNSRLDASELQVVMPAVTFGGAQAAYTFSFGTMADAEFATGAGNEREYTVTVHKADGSLYTNGAIYVGIEQLIDSSLSTTSTARLTNSAGTATVGVNGITQPLTTDANGQAKFYIAELNGNTNVSATPRVWIDLDAAGNTNGQFETGEPTLLGPTTTFQASLTQATSNLTIDTATAVKAGPFVTGDVINATFQLRNQSNTLSTTAGFNRVTYTITNTSGGTITFNPTFTNGAGGPGGVFQNMTSTFAGGSTTPFANGSAITLNAGSSVTLAGTAPGFVAANGANPDISTTTQSVLSFAAGAQDNTLSISATGTTVRQTVGSDARNVGSVSQAAQSKEIKNATAVAANETFTGEIIGFSVADTISNPIVATDNFGRLVVKLDGSGAIKFVNYGNNINGANLSNDLLFMGTDGTFTSPATNFNQLTTGPTTADQRTSYNTFENALAIGNRVNSSEGATVRRFYLANTTGASTTNATGNDLAAIPVDNITSSVASDANNDGFYDTLVVTFAQNVVASSVEIGDFAIPGATVTTVNSTGNTVVNVTIADGVLPVSAQFPEITVNAVTLADGTVVGYERQASTNTVTPAIKAATTVQTYATATLTSTDLGGSIVLTLNNATVNGAIGNNYTIQVVDGGMGGLAVTNAAGVVTVDIGGDTPTVGAVIAAINGDPTLNMSATNGAGSSLASTFTAAGAIINFTGGQDVVTIDFNKDIKAATVDTTAGNASNDLTLALGAFTGTTVVTDANTVTTTITVATDQVKADTITIATGGTIEAADDNVSLDSGTAPNTGVTVN